MDNILAQGTGFIPIKGGLAMHDSSFKNRHIVRLHAKGSLKGKNTINTCLIRLNTILYYF